MVAALRPDDKPKLSPEAADSEELYEAWNTDVEAWGDTQALKLGVVCRWASVKWPELGLTCPAPPPDS